jgi:hypothetical protein
MTRNISFSATTEQVRARTKEVTRRTGWKDLSSGEVLCAVEKGQGLKKGEKVTRICFIEIRGVRSERLGRILDDPVYGRQEMILEGFPGRNPADFCAMFVKMNHLDSVDAVIKRIRFGYVDRRW